MAAPGLIIGLGHKKRVGKDTLAGMLDDKLVDRGYRVYRLDFAQEMKGMAQNLYGWAGLRGWHHYETHPEEREAVLPALGLTPRQVWIQFGNAMRCIHAGTWVELMRRRIVDCLNYTALDVRRPAAFIITDVRYPNEAEAIRSWGGLLVKVSRVAAPYNNDVADTALDGFAGWDDKVQNNRTLADLANKAYWLAGRLVSLRNHNLSNGEQSNEKEC